MERENLGPILLFDGVCNLCNGFVKEVITRDPKGIVRYASLQSTAGQQLLASMGLKDFSMDTVVLIEGKEIFVKSDVALRLFRHLGGGWSYLYYLSIIPKFIRDTVYDLIARNRYRWFGKKEVCMLPRPEWEDRFL